MVLPSCSKRAKFVALPLAIVGEFFIGSHRCSAEEVQSDPQPPRAKSDASLRPATATAEEINAWIKELNDDAFTVRQSAAANLLTAGIPARQALLELVDGSDPEVRASARRLVALIDRTEFTQHLEAFASDTDGRRGLTLPGWEQFREVVGGDAAARALFVDMQRQEGAMLSAVFGVSAQPPEQVWEERLVRLVSWQPVIGNRTGAPPLGSCATMLFLGSVSEINVTDRGAMLLESLIQRPPIREALAAAGPQDAIRRLVAGWILHCPNKTEAILLRRLGLMSLTNLKETLPLALAVAGDDPQYASVQPTTRAAAVLLVGQFGGPDHVEKLEPLLEDATVCMPLQAQIPGRPAANVQVRDVALVVMLQLTDQRPADYGYHRARLQPQRTFQLQTLQAENDQQRAEAVAKWRQWRESQGGRGARVEGQVPEAREENPKP